MPTLQELRDRGIIPTSKLIKELLYGENSYYGEHVTFTTQEKAGDFATHATTGKALAFLIAHKMHEIFVHEFKMGDPRQAFVCHELSGGNGQLSHDILRIIQLMSEGEMAGNSKERSWTNLWNKVHLRTFEISAKLSDEQNVKLEKFNHPKLQSVLINESRYRSINKKASKKEDPELVYLTFSNEIFDALPSDVIYRDSESKEFGMQFCFPVVAHEALAAIGIQPRPIPIEYNGAAVDGVFLARAKKLDSGEYVIAPLSAVAELPEVEYLGFFIPLSQIDGLKYADDIIKYCDESELAPGMLTTYSAPYMKLLKVLSNKRNLHHLHFDYFVTHMPQFTSCARYFRQYPADDEFQDLGFGRAFAFKNNSVDITYNPDLHLAARVFAEQGLESIVAHQAAPYIVQSAEFEKMLEMLFKSDDEKFFGSVMCKDIAKFITESTADFKFFEAARSLQPQNYALTTFAPLTRESDIPASIAKIAFNYFSPFMCPAYDLTKYLNDDQIGKKAAKAIGAWKLNDLCLKFDRTGSADDLSILVKALLKQPLLLNQEITMRGETITPWVFLMTDPRVTAETISNIFYAAPPFILDQFAMHNGKLLVQNEEIDFDKRKLLLELMQFWQFCLHLCIAEGFKPGVDHLLKLYKNPDFSAFTMAGGIIKGNLPKPTPSDFDYLRLMLAPAEFLAEKQKYKKMKV